MKYGSIWDVALNASNGWVLQLDEGGLNSVIGTSCEGEQQEEWSCNSYGTAADTDLCEVASTPSDPSHRLSELDGSLTELARHFTV